MKHNREFFHTILGSNNSQKIDKLVIVTHLVPGSDVFLLAINEKLPIAAVIPKPNSIDCDIRDKVSNHIPVLDYTRQQIKENPKEFLHDLSVYIGDFNFAIIDTGGYFAHVLHELESFFGRKLVGIVEDTENGHQKYEAVLATNEHGSLFACPVISVARSALKNPEDYLVGQAIVFSAEALLRDLGQIITGKHAVVFGYGKIGSSIASHLHSKGVRVDVYDSCPVRQVLALAHGHHTGDKGYLLSSADLVFCATGNQSLKVDDLNNIKQNAYVFTATSIDDEIENHHWVIKQSTPHINGSVSQIKLHDTQFYLCNNGNSANFMHGGVVGPFIKLVQAELILALGQLSNSPKDRVCQLGDKSKKFIADLWVDLFAR